MSLEFQWDEACRFPEIPRYMVDFSGNAWDTIKNKQMRMKTRKKHRNYCDFNLMDRRSTKWLVHRVVAKTFVPNPHGHNCVDHWDGDNTNNHMSNLRWVTYSVNAAHRVHGTKRRDALPQNVTLVKGRYKVRFKLNFRNLYFGTYSTLEAAVEVAKIIRKLLFRGQVCDPKQR